MKLNLGCGQHPVPDFINVDKYPGDGVDVVCDLEEKWPWETDSIDEVIFHHSLEHMGETAAGFIHIMKELYRVCKNGAKIDITVPHPFHDNFISDPTHVRAVTDQMLLLFSKKKCKFWKEVKAPNTPLALYHDVDFEIVQSESIIDDEVMQKVIEKGEIMCMAKFYRNVIVETRIVLQTIKGV